MRGPRGSPANARSGEESGRHIRIATDSKEEICHLSTGRFFIDRSAFRTTGRVPLDGVGTLPAVDVLFARAAAEVLFDPIVARVRSAQWREQLVVVPEQQTAGAAQDSINPSCGEVQGRA